MNDSLRQASAYILANRDELATAVARQIYKLGPDEERPAAYDISWRDVQYHLTYLTEALLADDRALFEHYLEWLHVVFKNIGLADSTVSDTLQAMNVVLSQALPADLVPPLQLFLSSENLQFAEPIATTTYLEVDAPLHDLCRQYVVCLLHADRRQASRIILGAVEEGLPVRDVYLHVFQRAQYEIGRLWQMNEISVAQEHFSTAVTQLIMSQLYPYIFNTQKNGRHLVAACVSPELHEIGARFVADFFEMEGWDTYYLGANVPYRSILEAIKLRQADVLAISTTMTFHLSQTGELVQKIRETDVGKQVKIIVGGYPFNVSPNLWQQIKADGSATNAQEAVYLANSLLAAG